MRGSEHAGDEPAARREARGALFAVPPPVVLEKRVAPTRDESMRRVSGSPPRGLGTTADTGVMRWFACEWASGHCQWVHIDTALYVYRSLLSIRDLPLCCARKRAPRFVHQRLDQRRAIVLCGHSNANISQTPRRTKKLSRRVGVNAPLCGRGHLSRVSRRLSERRFRSAPRGHLRVQLCEPSLHGRHGILLCHRERPSPVRLR